MNFLNKRMFYFLSFIGLFGASAATAQPVCPVCTVAVCAGLGLARWLKIDDSITGLWIAGLIIAIIGWTLKYFEKKNWNFKARALIISAVFYLSAILPLYFMDIIGDPLHKILGVDKLMFGISIGSIGFALSIWLDKYLRKNNEGKARFAYQKVILPVGALLILSFLFEFVILKFC